MKLAFALLLALNACKPTPKQDSHIDYLFNAQSKELTIRVNLPEGMHAYAPGEPLGRPIELIINTKNGWKLAKPANLPSGDAKHLLHGEFKIKAELTNGRGPVTGVFKMQICSDNSCERPKDYAFQVGL